jgi:hypothetical protein
MRPYKRGGSRYDLARPIVVIQYVKGVAALRVVHHVDRKVGRERGLNKRLDRPVQPGLILPRPHDQDGRRWRYVCLHMGHGREGAQHGVRYRSASTLLECRLSGGLSEEGHIDESGVLAVAQFFASVFCIAPR